MAPYDTTCHPLHHSVTVSKSRNSIRAAQFRAPPSYTDVFHILTDGLKIEGYSCETDEHQLPVDRGGHQTTDVIRKYERVSENRMFRKIFRHKRMR